MQILTFKWKYRIPDRRVQDVERMVRIARQNGYVISSSDASLVWSEYSEGYAAGWLIMDDVSDQEILNILLDYTERDDMECF